MKQSKECLHCVSQGVVCAQTPENPDTKFVKITGGMGFVRNERIKDCPIYISEKRKKWSSLKRIFQV
jgi:hypothetical protein